MAQVAQAGKGVVLYMRRKAAASALLPKLKAYKLQQEERLDTVEAQPPPRLRPRPAPIRHRCPDPVRPRRPRHPLLTNNPRKVVGLDGYGLRIVESVPIQMEPNPHNSRYLKTKKDKLGHLLDEME